MAERRSDWVEILEPRSRERMYVNLVTGECGWEAPAGVNVRQSDGNQWWELFDNHNNRFYYYNSTSQQTVWHRPQACDIVPLAQLQAIKKSSEAELRGHGNSGRNTLVAAVVSPNSTASQELDSSRETPSLKSRGGSLEKRSEGSREPNPRWQPAPGSKAAMLVKVSGSGRNQHTTPASPRPLIHLSLPTSNTPSPIPTYPNRTASFGKMDPKQSLHLLKKADSGNFSMGMPSSGAPSSTNALRPSSPQYAATPPVPIYDEPPTSDPPIYDEPPADMEVEGADYLTHDPYRPTQSMPRLAPPPKLLQFPQAKHKRHPSAGEYSAAGRECIKHMVNVDLQQGESPKEEVSLEKKQPWHSRQSSLASQEYPPPSTVTYQDSGYSTGPSPSLRRKNRRRAVPGHGAGSGSDLSDKLMAEMKVALMSSEGSLKSTTLPGPISGSGEDTMGSERSLYSRHGDATLTSTEGLAGGQKRTYEKVDSLEKSEASHTSLSSPEPPASPSQAGTLESKSQPDFRSQHGKDRNDEVTVHGTTSVSSLPALQVHTPTSGATYQYPYSTLCKPPIDVDMEAWATKNLNQHTRGLLRRRVSIATMLSWSNASIRKPMLITSDRAIKKEACDMFKLVQAYMGDRQVTRLDRRHVALHVVTKCWSMQGLRDELYVQLIRQTTDNLNLSSLCAGWELMAISLAFFSPSPKFRRYLEGYIQRHLEPSHDKKILQRIVEQQDIKNKKNSKSRKKRKQNNEEEEEQGTCLPISTYAKYCYRKLQKVAVTGGKKGLRKPTLDEIDHGRNAIVTPSLFGSALEEIMERQSQRFPQRRLPWVQVQLSQCVLALGGAQTEGIFRVPGDIDEVNALKLQVDQWKIPENLSDPNVPASLLKLWYRELEEPVIPQSFYMQCISHYEDAEAAISVVQALPELNRLVLCYFIHFLQVFAQPVNVSKTKMDVNNLAMVMAPNCLRCQSDDPRIIFENTRKEMSFLRILIVHLDTSFIKDLV
ncbi:rho GTPase-activating protein 39 isoform X1 [Hemibagrus wyckioides]|uniref:rho GTPase-activating protein 39 isoform X1 n=2 Tax=Hemibagrus wyckioides TaxID=337641 RepID=UPI00266D8787|nr:rho GTPase-activating protein 39 isoform X1 [Hemibagrus wyckioides]